MRNCAIWLWLWLWFIRFDENMQKKIPFHTIHSRLNSNDYTLVKRTEKTHKWNISWREKKGIYQEKGNWWYNLKVALFKNSHTHCGRALTTAAPPSPPNRTGKNHDFLFFPYNGKGCWTNTALLEYWSIATVWLHCKSCSNICLATTRYLLPTPLLRSHDHENSNSSCTCFVMNR